MTRTFLRLALIVAMPVSLALSSVPASAAAPSATVVISPTAQLQPLGTALLTIDYQCQPGFFGGVALLETELEQPGTFGFSFTINMTCDDQKHRVAFNNAPGPFSPGSASAFAFVSNGSFNSFKLAQAEVTVK
jgi:hypothetical protein